MRSDALLYRQIHPTWIQMGRVTSQAFKPTPKDKKRLSAYDGDQVTPEDAWNHYTRDLGFLSSGVLAVTVGECQALELPAVPDPERFPAHVLIAFDACTNSEIERKAKRLRALATQRGWQYQIEVEAGSSTNPN